MADEYFIVVLHLLRQGEGRGPRSGEINFLLNSNLLNRFVQNEQTNVLNMYLS